VEYIENGEYFEIKQFIKPTNFLNFTYDYSLFNSRKVSYDPLALHIGTVSTNKKFTFDQINIRDLRLKGGGVKPLENTTKLLDQKPNILNFSDLYSGKGYLYPNGGYVIIKIPKEVKDNFISKEEVYNIVRSNLTAGIAFDIQDMDGNDWNTV